MENYSLIKRNDILIYSTIWINLENAMPSKRNQSQSPYNI